MMRKGRLAAFFLLLLAACSKTEEVQEGTLPAPATLRILSESVALTPGGEAYAEFRISPFETQVNSDTGGDRCSISVLNVTGEEVSYFTVSRVEPAGSDYSDKGTYRVFLKDALAKISYNQRCRVIYKDAFGRVISSDAFNVTCKCDELTQSLLDTGLPLLRIDTEGKVEPTCEYVSHPEGCNGAGIKNAVKVPGELTLMKGDNILHSTGPFKKDESGMTLKIRGNTSAYGAKKPFKIKLQKKKDLLCRGDESKYKDKDWLLLYYDDLRMLAGTEVNRKLGIQWTPSFEFVNLVVNGDYRGIYLLCEAVERNERCRLNVSESGYVIEYDAYWWNEDVHFTGGWNYSMEYTFKYPEDDEVTGAQIKYIQDYIQKVETSVKAGDYDKYIDVLSFARWLLGHDVLGILDCAGSNYFLTKYDNTANSKLMMANMWDFDSIYRMKDSWSNTHNWGANYFTTLLRSPNTTFKDTYIALWESQSVGLCKTLSAFMKSFVNSETGRALDASIPLDNKRWRASHPTVEQSVATSREWFDTRGQWLDAAITALK